MKSVLSQTAVISGRAELDYLVVDGASSDRTGTVAEGFDDVRVISESDNGMYDALSKGLILGREPEPTVCAYLNAGDMWHERALDIVLDVFEQRPDIQWITGYRSAVTPEGYYVSISQPYAYRTELIRSGAYGRHLPFIQQESTFWRGGLLTTVDMSRLASFRLAGDQYLWSSFASKARLFVVCALLGGFRMHDAHLSDDRAAYRTEMLRINSDAPSKAPFMLATHRLLWASPNAIKKAFGGEGILSYDVSNGRWSPPMSRAAGRLRNRAHHGN